MRDQLHSSAPRGWAFIVKFVSDSAHQLLAAVVGNSVVAAEAVVVAGAAYAVGADCAASATWSVGSACSVGAGVGSAEVCLATLMLR